ncbi:hypothetical protein [Bacillus sp. RS11]|uniref:hypothetical protein n=1 Tax=Lysinibacillus sp. RS11 TaxID=3242682 RepID=UPI0035C7588B
MRAQFIPFKIRTHCLSVATATNVYQCESEATATNVFCSESKASATITPRRNCIL